jgi:hypothetical protein
MSDNLKVKIAVMANRTWSEIRPQRYVLAFIAAVAGVLQQPLGEGERGMVY